MIRKLVAHNAYFVNKFTTSNTHRTLEKILSSEATLSMSPNGFNMFALLFSTDATFEIEAW